MRASHQGFTAATGEQLARDPWDLATLLLLAALTAIALATYSDYAISNDEEVQRQYGALIIAFYRSGFTDQALFHFKNLYLYGGLFDVISGLLEWALPKADPFTIRHILCALTGIAGIAACALIARLIAGPRAGLIAAAILCVCGPWYGAMFNHTKDIPFAAAMAGAFYFLLRVMRGLPRPQWRDVIGFGVLLGASLGLRVLGLLLIVYAGLAIALRTAQLSSAPQRNTQWRDALGTFSQSVIALIPAFAIGYAIMIAAWPWAGLSPLNPVRGLIDFGDFHYRIRTILDGQIYEMATVPRWYIPAYLLIKLPLILLAGAAISLIDLTRRWRDVRSFDRNAIETVMLLVAALLPVLCQVVDRGPAFSGLRHFLFVVPMFAALAGIGFDRVLPAIGRSRPVIAAGAAAILVAMLAWNAVTLVRLHPYQYLFYNPLVGGLQGAAGRYVTDYWVNIMSEAVDELEAYVAQLDRTIAHPARYTVAVCGERLPFEKEAGQRLQWTEDWKRAEFFIAPTHMNCDRALQGRVIAAINRLGARIGVVKDRRDLLSSDLLRLPGK